jgi:hypothetical protein
VYAAYITFAILFTFVAVTTGFATHSGFSLIHLSDQYAAATTAAQRIQLLATACGIAQALICQVFFYRALGLSSRWLCYAARILAK